MLALKTLCGFSTAEIALRLFPSEGNVIKRLGRARDRLREVPPDFTRFRCKRWTPDCPVSIWCCTCVFNEGYLSAQPDRTIRRELCDEAIRLTTLLAEHPVGATPETFALLALMHLHTARLNARLDAMGGLLLLEEQDRSLWDQDHMRLGAAWLRKSASGETFTRFHAEAGIAAEHVFASSFAETRWNEIADLYEMLERVAPSPLNAMNQAVVIAEWHGPRRGLLPEVYRAARHGCSDTTCGMPCLASCIGALAKTMRLDAASSARLPRHPRMWSASSFGGALLLWSRPVLTEPA